MSILYHKFQIVNSFGYYNRHKFKEPKSPSLYSIAHFFNYVCFQNKKLHISILLEHRIIMMLVDTFINNLVEDSSLL